MEDHARTHLQLAVCDDEAADRAQIGKMAGEILREEKLPAEIACYDSADALLAAIRAGRAFDILLLDVMMEGMDGMALAAALREGHDAAAIVFISSSRDMALQGYEVEAARYLTKPLRREKLREALVYCGASRAKRRPLVLPTASGGQSRIDPAAIVYVEAWERGARLNLGTEKVETRLSLWQIAAMLPKGPFVYCHRALLVNLAYVRHVRFYELVLDSGERLPISKHRYAQFKNEFLEYLDD